MTGEHSVTRYRRIARAIFVTEAPIVTRGAYMIGAMCAAIMGAAVAWVVNGAYAATPEAGARDAMQLWRGARALLDGLSPYAIMDWTGLPYPYRDPFAYPLTAVIPWLPFTDWDPAVFGAAISALGLAALILASVRRPALLWSLPTWGLHRAVFLSQWSPLLTAGAMLPALQLFFVCKPNLGLALFLAFPSRWAVAGGVLWGGLAFWFMPDWPLQWLGDVGTMPFYVSPVTVWQGGGPLLLLALLRWRHPEGRLLAALSILPSNMIYYDQLPLFLTARTHKQGAWLCAWSWAAAVVGAELNPLNDVTQMGLRAPIVAFCYLPALVLVLRYPRIGGEPDWLPVGMGVRGLQSHLKGIRKTQPF